MSEKTNIEWCDSTWNPWMGCTKISPACDNCYASVSTPARTLGVTWGAGQPRRRTSKANWALPLRWDAQATAFHAQHGRRQRVFCASLADVFDNEVPAEWRADLFRLIAATPNLDWLLLTKRIGNAAGMLAEMFLDGPPDNIWLGATICNQEEADRDIPKLLRTPARVRFLSIEPLLGPVAIWRWASRHCERHAGRLDPDGKCEVCEGRGIWSLDEPLADAEKAPIRNGLDWVIVGGESGHQARPMHPDWARDLRDQCAAAGVPFLFKQWGEWTPGENVERQRGTVDTAVLCDEWIVRPLNLATDHGHIDDQPDLYRVGKKAAGRLLDGVQHDGYPA